MKIYSPSYKRANGVKTHYILPDVIYCVHEFEAEEYIDKGYNVEVMPNEVGGNIARVRNYIKDNYIGDKGLMIDDDIEAIKVWTWKNELPKAVEVKDVEEFIEQGFNLCEQFGCRLWGINIIGDKGSYREYTPFSLNNTLSGSFMGFLNNELSFDERMPLKEDYDFSIQNANVYRKLLRLNYAHMIKKDHKNKGGCADYRTIEREKENMMLLQRKWGRQIVKQDKGNKGKKKTTYDINPVVKIPLAGV
jgi:hypothetical protein